MNSFKFEAEIVRAEQIPVEVVRERTYGLVYVSAEWPKDLSTLEIRVAVEVSGDIERIDAPAYVELFFHDVFLLLNLATPGSFGGIVSITGGELRVRELAFSPRVFEYAIPAERLPLSQVLRWYDRLQIGTQQLATNAATTALFQLLHLSRREENEEESILRLASAAAALGQSERRLFELRDALGQRTAVIHPMHDDALDPRVEDATREWIEVADDAAKAVIGALQEQIKNL
jgi:hypothetical protein